MAIWPALSFRFSQIQTHSLLIGAAILVPLVATLTIFVIGEFTESVEVTTDDLRTETDVFHLDMLQRRHGD